MTDRYLASPPYTIGDKELLAGVSDRDAFWSDLTPIFKTKGSEAGMNAWRLKVNKLIVYRVKSSQLSLLYPKQCQPR